MRKQLTNSTGRTFWLVLKNAKVMKDKGRPKSCLTLNETKAMLPPNPSGPGSACEHPKGSGSSTALQLRVEKMAEKASRWGGGGDWGEQQITPEVRPSSRYMS